MNNLKIIVEGSNLSGKTSIIKELEKKFVHSVIITLHGYYHPQLIKNFKNNCQEILRYHQKRLKSFLPIFKDIITEELIFNRFHLTASVYLKIFYNLEAPFFDLEEELNKLGVYLILADFNKEALAERLKEREILFKEPPWGDEDFSKTKLKRDLYRQFFKQSKIENKILIDNSNITAAQAVEEVQQKINFDL